MSARYSFDLQSQERRRDLPRRIIIGKTEVETPAHVLLKFLGFLLFYRDRLQIGVNLRMDGLPFLPALVQLDYELRPRLWIECGECSVARLDKLAVKVPEAEIWVLQPSRADAERLHAAMAKADLRRNRYGLIGLETEMLEELGGLLQMRNELLWVRGDFDPPSLQFDFNGLWFDTTFTVLRF